MVAITLLGLLMAALFGGLRLGARALPLEVMMLAEDGRLGFAFRGTGEEVRFAGALPEHLGAARLALTLAVDRRSVTIDAVPRPNNRGDLV